MMMSGWSTQIGALGKAGIRQFLLKDRHRMEGEYGEWLETYVAPALKSQRLHLDPGDL